MGWVSEEQIAAAREVDLLTYLQEREPWELKRTDPGEYRTVTHGSVVISNGKWYWNRGKFGGHTALDYLTKVCGVGFAEAVEAINGIRVSVMPTALPANTVSRKQEEKVLMLPERVKYSSKMAAYLQARGIDAALIQRCMEAGILYEGRYHGEAVCVFVGRDAAGHARFGCMRGISSDLKRDCAGSDKRFSFHMESKPATSGSVAAFEAPIDALAHACLFPDWDGHRLSLGGTSQVALLHFLESHPQISRVSLCLDADDAGRRAASGIQELLAEDARFSHLIVTIDPPSTGKDYNDMLLHTKMRERDQTNQRTEAGYSL